MTGFLPLVVALKDQDLDVAIGGGLHLVQRWEVDETKLQLIIEEVIPPKVWMTRSL